MRPSAVLALLLVAPPAFAVPMQISHQGRLLDANGDPLTGPHQLTVGLYTSGAGGTPVWTETRTVDLDAGYFTVALGEDVGNPLESEDLDHDAMYLGLAVDGGAQLPRQRVLSAPFAIRAGTATEVRGGVVDATEIRVGGHTVIDGSGAFSGTVSGPTLGGLTCTAGQIAIFDGADWTCGTNGPTLADVATSGSLGSGGDLNLRGNDGQAGNIDGGGNEEAGGNGGASFWGGAGTGGSHWAARTASSLYGSGGAGTHVSTHDCGGRGGDGIVVVREYGP